jgi:uncharacterized membrane protein YdbT with pleckstrin-like domain
VDKELYATYREFRPSWQSFGVYFLGAAIFLVGPMVNPEARISPALSQLLSTVFLGFILVKRFTTIYRLDQAKVRAFLNFPSSRTTEASLDKITRIDLRRGLTQRLLKVAHVHIYVEGKGDPVVKLFGVPQPDKFKELLLTMGAKDQPVHGAWRR